MRLAPVLHRPHAPLPTPPALLWIVVLSRGCLVYLCVYICVREREGVCVCVCGGGGFKDTHEHCAYPLTCSLAITSHIAIHFSSAGVDTPE